MPAGLLGPRRDTFVSPITALSIYRIDPVFEHQMEDTTTVDDTALHMQQGGFTLCFGRLYGWAKSGGPDWDTTSGTLTFALAAGGEKITSSTTYIRRKSGILFFGSRQNQKVPVVADFMMSGPTVSTP